MLVDRTALPRLNSWCLSGLSLSSAGSRVGEIQQGEGIAVHPRQAQDVSPSFPHPSVCTREQKTLFSNCLSRARPVPCRAACALCPSSASHLQDLCVHCLLCATSLVLAGLVRQVSYEQDVSPGDMRQSHFFSGACSSLTVVSTQAKQGPVGTGEDAVTW